MTDRAAMDIEHAEQDYPCSNAELKAIASNPLRAAVHFKAFADWFHQVEGVSDQAPSLDKVITRCINPDARTVEILRTAISLNTLREEQALDSYIDDCIEQDN